MSSRLPDQSELPPPAWPPVAPTATAPSRPSRARRYTLIGLTAGLLGGSAVGLAATVPAASQAAGDVPTLAVAEPDVGADREPGEWLRNTLQALVDDGTLTAEQLDAVVASLVEARPAGPMFGHGPGRLGRGERAHMLGDREEIAALLGIDVDTLTSELRSGTSLATLAEEHGVDVQAVIDLLVADAEARMADRAETIRERVTEMVNRSPGD